MLKMPSSLQQCSSSPISRRLRIGRERRLAGAREAEQQRRAARSCLSAVAEQCIDSTPRFGHEVVHDREDALLHLAGVLGAEDDELAASRGDRSTLVFDVMPVVRRLAGKLRRRCRSRRRARRSSSSSSRRRADQHVVHEQRVIRPRADRRGPSARLCRIPAGEAVDDVQLLPRVEVVDGPLAIDLETSRRRWRC